MKICLVGSTKFKEQYEKINKKLSLAGHVVYSVSCYGHSGDSLTGDDKIILDLVHLSKILESDAVVLVTNDENYIGFSTRRELKWAQMNSKKILDKNLDQLTWSFK